MSSYISHVGKLKRVKNEFIMKPMHSLRFLQSKKKTIYLTMRISAVTLITNPSLVYQKKMWNLRIGYNGKNKNYIFTMKFYYIIIFT